MLKLVESGYGIDVKAVSVTDFGAVGDGVTDDSTIAMNAATAVSLAGGGWLYFPAGTYLLTTFDWPANVKIVGPGKLKDGVTGITSDIHHVFRNNDDTLKTVFVHDAYGIAEMLAIKAAGFNTIMHYAQFGTLTDGTIEKVLRAAYAVNLKVIWAKQSITPNTSYEIYENLIGYYLFDEPQANGVTVADQNTRISAWRAATNLSLCCAEGGEYGFNTDTISDEFDIIFHEMYYYAALSDSVNKRNVILCFEEMSRKAPKSRLIPLAGLYTNSSDFTDKAKQIGLSKQIGRFSDGSFAVFGWDAGRVASGITALIDDADFMDRAKEIAKLPNTSKYESTLMLFQKTSGYGAFDCVKYYLADYSTDMKPFSVINVGSATNERNSTFTARGIGIANTGGIFATSFSSLGFVHGQLTYDNNYNSAALDEFYLLQSVDDFYYLSTFDDKFMGIAQQTSSIADGTSFRVLAAVPRGYLLGIGTETANTTTLFWKFLSGYLLTHNWIDETI